MSQKELYAKYKGLEFEHKHSSIVICGYDCIRDDSTPLLAAVTSGNIGPVLYNHIGNPAGCITHKNNALGYYWLSVDDIPVSYRNTHKTNN